MLTFARKYEVKFMRKSFFYKRVLHTKDGVIPQYCNKEGSYLKVIPHNNGNLDSELHTHNFYLILWIKKGQGTHSINFHKFSISTNILNYITIIVQQGYRKHLIMSRVLLFKCLIQKS